jgi:ribosome maturation factor RimP
MKRGQAVPSFYSKHFNHKSEAMVEREIISRLVEEKLADTANYLTGVEVKPGNLIVVEIDNDEGVSIDDCAALSHYLESQLDRETEDFELEVGSVGITSPFKVLKQYTKNVGKEVEVQLKSGTKLTGILKYADANGIVLNIEKQVKPEGAKRKQTVKQDLPFPMNEIKYTKYVIRFK